MIPGYFRQLDHIPVNPSGKLDREALPLPGSDRNAETPYVGPQNQVEEELVKIWKHVLGAGKVGIDDDFFLPGGDSIKAVQVMSILTADFEISMNDIFQYTTVRRLAEKIVYQKNHLRRKILQLKKEYAQNDRRQNRDQRKTLQYLNEYQKYTDIDLDSRKKYQVILLSGATGYLGLHLLHDIIKNTECRIYALLRKSNAGTGRQRLMNKLEYHFGKGFYNRYGSRIVAVNGDLTAENLGNGLG
jgi:acyl carrier protein